MLGWGAALSAEGVRLEGVGPGEGLASTQSTRGSEKRRELPQRGPERSPGRQRFWYIMGLQNDAGGT